MEIGDTIEDLKLSLSGEVEDSTDKLGIFLGHNGVERYVFNDRFGYFFGRVDFMQLQELIDVIESLLSDIV